MNELDYLKEFGIDLEVSLRVYRCRDGYNDWIPEIKINGVSYEKITSPEYRRELKRTWDQTNRK